MTSYHASWIVPIHQPPIRNGCVVVDRGRIVRVGARRGDAGRGVDPGERDLGAVVIMPGLVNAHTHLELSYLRNRIARSADFVSWVRQVMAARRAQPDPRDPEILAGVTRGIADAIAAGTALVGDISNTLVTFDALAASRLAAFVFYELLGFNAADPAALVERAAGQLSALSQTDAVRAGLAAHAPYSVSPGLFRAIRLMVDRVAGAPCSVHLSESQEEVQLIAAGDGPWRGVLEELGAWDSAWNAPGVSPVRYLQENGFLARGSVVVHGVQMSSDDLARLASCDGTLVTCPRSNAYTGAGVPPIDRFYASGVRVAVGTDSLASTPDLSVFAELAAMRAIAPSVPAAVLLDSATRQGATALGFETEYGTLERGRRARLLAVSAPPLASAADVEEYLVTSITPDAIGWVS